MYFKLKVFRNQDARFLFFLAGGFENTAPSHPSSPMTKARAPIHKSKVEWFPSRNFNTKLNSKEEILVTKNNVNHEKSFISFSSIALNLYCMVMSKYTYQLNEHIFIFFYGDTLSIPLG